MDNKIIEVFIPGPAGRLEAKYFKSKKNTSPIALILQPHPQYGGTMNNKVVVDVFRAVLPKYIDDEGNFVPPGEGDSDQVSKTYRELHDLLSSADDNKYLPFFSRLIEVVLSEDGGTKRLIDAAVTILTGYFNYHSPKKNIKSELLGKTLRDVIGQFLRELLATEDLRSSLLSSFLQLPMIEHSDRLKLLRELDDEEKDRILDPGQLLIEEVVAYNTKLKQPLMAVPMLAQAVLSLVLACEGPRGAVEAAAGGAGSSEEASSNPGFPCGRLAAIFAHKAVNVGMDATIIAAFDHVLESDNMTELNAFWTYIQDFRSDAILEALLPVEQLSDSRWYKGESSDKQKIKLLVLIERIPTLDEVGFIQFLKSDFVDLIPTSVVTNHKDQHAALIASIAKRFGDNFANCSSEKLLKALCHEVKRLPCLFPNKTSADLGVALINRQVGLLRSPVHTYPAFKPIIIALDKAENEMALFDEIYEAVLAQGIGLTGHELGLTWAQKFNNTIEQKWQLLACLKALPRFNKENWQTWFGSSSSYALTRLCGVARGHDKLNELSKAFKELIGSNFEKCDIANLKILCRNINAVRMLHASASFTTDGTSLNEALACRLVTELTSSSSISFKSIKPVFDILVSVDEEALFDEIMAVVCSRKVCIDPGYRFNFIWAETYKSTLYQRRWLMGLLYSLPILHQDKFLRLFKEISLSDTWNNLCDVAAGHNMRNELEDKFVKRLKKDSSLREELPWFLTRDQIKDKLNSDQTFEDLKSLLRLYILDRLIDSNASKANAARALDKLVFDVNGRQRDPGPTLDEWTMLCKNHPCVIEQLRIGMLKIDSMLRQFATKLGIPKIFLEKGSVESHSFWPWSGGAGGAAGGAGAPNPGDPSTASAPSSDSGKRNTVDPEPSAPPADDPDSAKVVNLAPSAPPAEDGTPPVSSVALADPAPASVVSQDNLALTQQLEAMTARAEIAEKAAAEAKAAMVNTVTTVTKVSAENTALQEQLAALQKQLAEVQKASEEAEVAAREKVLAETKAATEMLQKQLVDAQKAKQAAESRVVLIKGALRITSARANAAEGVLRKQQRCANRPEVVVDPQLAALQRECVVFQRAAKAQQDKLFEKIAALTNTTNAADGNKK